VALVQKSGEDEAVRGRGQRARSRRRRVVEGGDAEGGANGRSCTGVGRGPGGGARPGPGVARRRRRLGRRHQGRGVSPGPPHERRPAGSCRPRRRLLSFFLAAAPPAATASRWHRVGGRVGVGSTAIAPWGHQSPAQASPELGRRAPPARGQESRGEPRPACGKGAAGNASTVEKAGKASRPPPRLGAQFGPREDDVEGPPSVTGPQGRGKRSGYLGRWRAASRPGGGQSVGEGGDGGRGVRVGHGGGGVDGGKARGDRRRGDAEGGEGGKVDDAVVVFVVDVVFFVGRGSPGVGGVGTDAARRWGRHGHDRDARAVLDNPPGCPAPRRKRRGRRRWREPRQGRARGRDGRGRVGRVHVDSSSDDPPQGPAIVGAPARALGGDGGDWTAGSGAAGVGGVVDRGGGGDVAVPGTEDNDGGRPGTAAPKRPCRRARPRGDDHPDGDVA